MDKKRFFQELLTDFNFTPTPTQLLVFEQLSYFLMAENSSEMLFLLKGFAGTGKTAIVHSLIKNLPKIKHNAILLAPTGRAAKVMSLVAGQQAFTIHKFIYYQQTLQTDFSVRLKANKFQNTLFIVDEASMISDSDGQFFEKKSLLDDLFSFVYNTKNCKLLLIGDTAQLPPIGTNQSPALNADALYFRYRKEIIENELTDVVRQEKQSGILANATLLREAIFNTNLHKNNFFLRKFKDVMPLTEPIKIQEMIEKSYDFYGIDQTAIIVKSNKRAVLYNKQIRKVILDIEDELSVGDLLMVVKNNYFWLKEEKTIQFIANGDIIEVLQIYNFIDLYGFRFANVKVQLVDYQEVSPFDTIILLDTIDSETPSLSLQQLNDLYNEVSLDYADETSSYKRNLKVKENPYFNALQVKFSYAITCHKSQGGQWKAVFIEKPYLPDGIDTDYLRWLYTALTRASRRVFLLNFKEDDFFKKS